MMRNSIARYAAVLVGCGTVAAAPAQALQHMTVVLRNATSHTLRAHADSKSFKPWGSFFLAPKASRTLTSGSSSLFIAIDECGNAFFEYRNIAPSVRAGNIRDGADWYDDTVARIGEGKRELFAFGPLRDNVFLVLRNHDATNGYNYDMTVKSCEGDEG